MNRVLTRKELAEGWGPGYKELGWEEEELAILGPAEQEANDNLGSRWLQWLSNLVCRGTRKETKKEPKPDPTLDPNWKPGWC